MPAQMENWKSWNWGLRMFSEKARTVVLTALAMADYPLSIPDIAFRTGLGYNTVKRVVFSDANVVKHGGRPAKYTVEQPSALDRSLLVVKYDRPEQGWGPWLEEIRPLLPTIASLPEGMTKVERTRKINMFESLGTSFLSLAKDLEEGQ